MNRAAFYGTVLRTLQNDMIGRMMTRIAVGLGIAALLIPVSMLIGLSAGKSILVSAIVGFVFIAMAIAMSKLLKS